MGNLLAQTRSKAGKDTNLFYFTTMEKIQKGNPLTKPIWVQTDKEDRVPVLDLTIS